MSNFPTIRDLSSNIGCLSLEFDSSTTYHPSCQDAQLFVLQQPNGSYQVINRIPIQGAGGFLAFPITPKLGELSDKVSSPCVAADLNAIICQNTLLEPTVAYRGFGFDSDDPCEKQPYVVGTARADGTYTFSIELSRMQADGIPVNPEQVLGVLKKAFAEQMTILKNDTPTPMTSEHIKAVQQGVYALSYDGDSDPEKLQLFLNTLVTCSRNNLDVIIGLLPPNRPDGVFILTFDNVVRDDLTQPLVVPCLSLVHEDMEWVSEELPDPLHQVRASYWVCYLGSDRRETAL